MFYDCDNKEFVEFIQSTGYFEEGFGTFTDICIIAPALDCSAVNLSSGYYKEHSKSEYINLAELNETIKQTKEIIKMDCQRFEWVEKKFDWKRYWKYDDWYDYYGDDCGDVYSYYEKDKLYEFIYGKKGEKCEEIIATSEDEAIGIFLRENPDICFNDIYAYYEV